MMAHPDAPRACSDVRTRTPATAPSATLLQLHPNPNLPCVFFSYKFFLACELCEGFPPRVSCSSRSRVSLRF